MKTSGFDVSRPALEVEVAEAIKLGDHVNDGVIRQLAFERDRLKGEVRDLQDEVSKLNAYCHHVHPRVWKMVAKGRNFLVIGEHEPYYLEAYKMIRDQEMKQGTWTEEDRVAFGAAQLAGTEYVRPERKPMTTATITCSKCGQRIEVSDLLNADLQLLCDSQAAEVERLRSELAQLQHRYDLATIPPGCERGESP